MAAVSAGSTGSAFLNHHKADTVGGTIVHPEFTAPAWLGRDLAERFGPWPDESVPDEARIERATTVLLEHVLPTCRPDVAAVWLSEPDSAEHATGVGSEAALKSIRAADTQLGRILAYLDDRGLSASTDLLVGSDHGLSTVSQVVDIRALLVREGIKRDPESGDVLVADNGGSVSIYVPGHDRNKVRSIAELLMKQSWCGPIFARSASEPPAGILPMTLISNENERSADILMSFSWEAGANSHGVPGTATSGITIPAGRGTHGSLSPYEMHNVLVAAGPHFKQGVTSLVPSGNVDILPTVLSMAGLDPRAPTDGRVLAEALRDGPSPDEMSVSTDVRETSAPAGDSVYHQDLQMSRVGETVYVGRGRAWRS